MSGEPPVAGPSIVAIDRLPSEHWPPKSRYGQRAVVLANDPSGVVARSVAALASLPDDLPQHALVGGLAAMVRLYAPHRVTTDFDEVSRGRDAAIERLLAAGAERTTSGVALVRHGVRLDLLDAETDLETLAALGAELDGEADSYADTQRRAVQLAMVCRYALETAVATDIIVLDGDDVAARIELPVAVAGGLVAMKVHSALAADRAAGKAASDVYDAWRLVRAWGPAVVAEDLSRAPVVMIETTRREIAQLFVNDVDRTVRWLASTSVGGVEQLDAESLEPVGDLVELLEPFTVWDRR